MSQNIRDRKVLCKENIIEKQKQTRELPLRQRVCPTIKQTNQNQQSKKNS